MLYAEIRAASGARPWGFLPATIWALTLFAMTAHSQSSASCFRPQRDCSAFPSLQVSFPNLPSCPFPPLADALTSCEVLWLKFHHFIDSWGTKSVRMQA